MNIGRPIECCNSMSANTPLPADSRLLAALQRHWGYSAFLPHQGDAIHAICNARDTLVVLPTGGGKSMCYQLPAVVHGRAIVVSPLISLMQDQVAALQQHGVAAASLNRSVSAPDAGRVFSEWRAGKLALLYVAPERLLIPTFMNFIAAYPPKFLAVDEAHCISHWGHDFRPEYRNLQLLRERFADVPIVALTATATELVRRDIIEQLQLRDPALVVGDFDRPNLHYRAERRSNRNTQIEEVLRAHAGNSGIIYCISRNDSERVAEHLVKRGFMAAAYHAGLEHDVRRRVQREFSDEQLDAIVATVAFGMGIDRSNVRFVIHAGMPASIEHYQQETGRAGRDGLPAECVLLYSFGDKIKWQSIFEKDGNTPEDVLESKQKKLEQMLQFAIQRQCRHKYLVEYFGQKWQKGTCGNCDSCSDRAADPRGEAAAASTIIAQKILSSVVRLKEGYGAGYVIALLRGETDHLQPAHCGLSTFGLLRDHSAPQIRTWIDECLAEHLLTRSAGQFPTLSVTGEGWLVLRGQKHARLSEPRSEDRAARREAKEKRIREHHDRADLHLQGKEQALFDALRRMRLQLAKQKNVAAYVILHDRTLVEIARARPTTLDQLAAVPGIGEAKLSVLGETILQTIRLAGTS